MDESTLRQQFEGFTRSYLKGQQGDFATSEELDSAMSKAKAVMRLEHPDLPDTWFNSVFQDVRDKNSAIITIGNVLIDDTDETYEPWLDQASVWIEPYYWSRYSLFLVEQQALPSGVVSVMDKESSSILGLCGDPGAHGAWDRRGLVMGHVQSGKTANYIALMCKAADAGYKIIIVIAGVSNILRSQTQARIDEGFIGYDSVAVKQTDRPEEILIGVGKIDPRHRPMTLTTRISDFKKSLGGLRTPLENQTQPVVFVIKKNSSVLKALLDWLKRNALVPGKKQVDAPLLLIDDEADNASINTKYKANEVTAINRHLRSVLGLFSKSTYVGYTATPFANIFIDPLVEDPQLHQDLFPKSFIVSLNAPTNYFDARKIFIDEQERFLRVVDDSEYYLPMRHDKFWEVDGLPESLREAIRCFFLAAAIRTVRGQGEKHCSMMINASRFVDVQARIGNLVRDYENALASSCREFGRLPDALALHDANLAALKGSWEREYAESCGDWSSVKDALARVGPTISTVVINGKSGDALNYGEYEHGRKVIAVGGLALSRGLTIEGLTVSYYLRHSVMYDTLMQMGRWFGYRPNYEDLCRIFMTEESIGHYEHVTDSVAELQSELREMQQAGATPTEFGLKVRSHPDTLMITARNKVGSAEEVEWDIMLANRLIETSKLELAQTALSANRDAAVSLGRELLDTYQWGNPLGSKHYLFSHVPAPAVLRFIRDFKNSPVSLLTDIQTVLEYISPRVGDELAEWDVLFPSVTGPSVAGDRWMQTMTGGSSSMAISCEVRTVAERTTDRILYSTKDRISSRGIEKYVLTQDVVKQVDREFKDDPGNKSKSVPDVRYREKMERPLLIVHFVQFLKDQLPLTAEPAVAWSISFPGTLRPSTPVKYMVNSVFLQEMLPLAEDETDDYDDEAVNDG